MTPIYATQRQDILCPKCERVTQAAAVLYEGMPFWAYAHKCECGYWITESEWKSVKEYPVQIDGSFQP